MAGCRRVKVMADYGAFPLWSLDGDDEGAMLQADRFALSRSLRHDLEIWAREYDGLMTTGYE